MQKTTEYNCDALQRLATRLRRRALLVMVLWPVIGVLAGAYVGLDIAGNLSTVIGAVVGTYLGYLIGSMRSLYYNALAINALCLKQIEENTRSR